MDTLGVGYRGRRMNPLSCVFDLLNFISPHELHQFIDELHQIKRLALRIGFLLLSFRFVCILSDSVTWYTFQITCNY